MRPRPIRPRRRDVDPQQRLSTLWAAHNVRIHRIGVKDFHHAAVGDLSLTYEMMELSADIGLAILAYSWDGKRCVGHEVKADITELRCSAGIALDSARSAPRNATPNPAPAMRVATT